MPSQLSSSSSSTQQTSNATHTHRRTIFTNGQIYRGTHKDGFQKCSSLVISPNGCIEYLGDGGEDLTKRIPNLNQARHDHNNGDDGDDNEQRHDTTIDLDQKVVLPSFIDAHMHILLFGTSLLKTSLDDCRSLEQIRTTILAAAKADPTAKRILCREWRQSSTNREAYTWMLDDLDPRPIYIDSFDLHSAWVNSAALREMGVDRDTVDPVGGGIARDGEGNPTGLISEGAVIELVWGFLIGIMSREEKESGIMEAMREYHTNGYTGVVDMAMDEGMWNVLEEMYWERKLNMRVAAHWLIRPTGNEIQDLAQVQTAIDMHKKYNLANSPDFRIAGIKCILDGVVDSCTAALSTPYLVQPYGDGQLMWEAGALERVAAKADAAGLQIACHAIGDAAINLAINTLETSGSTGRRHRIEHLELTRPEDAKRLGKLGITASVQPVHSDPSILTAWPELIGRPRCGWAFAHHDFRDHGAQLAFGTDSPTAPHYPLPNLYVANTRKSARDSLLRFKINDRPGIDLHHAINASTWGAAYSSFADDFTGSLDIGKKADFIVLEGMADPLDADSLLHAHVAETWLSGKKVYAR